MSAIVVCAACQTKLKVPENTTAKALRCPKCKGAVPLAAPKKPSSPPEAAKPKPKPPSPPPEEEFEVNEAADHDEDDESEADEETEAAKDSALAKLGFLDVEDVFEEGGVPDDAREAIEKSFIKKEKALWAGRPDPKIIESSAWIGLVVGPIALLVALGACGGGSAFALLSSAEMMVKLIVGGFAAAAFLMFGGVGAVAIIFRKSLGGNAAACYVLTNKRAYIYDGSHHVRAFSPEQLVEMKSQEASGFPGAGDLIFAYDLMGDAGVQVDKETAQRAHGPGAQPSTPVGFLAIQKLKLVRQMINEILVQPVLDTMDDKGRKKKKKKDKEKRPFG